MYTGCKGSAKVLSRCFLFGFKMLVVFCVALCEAYLKFQEIYASKENKFCARSAIPERKPGMFLDQSGLGWGDL